MFAATGCGAHGMCGYNAAFAERVARAAALLARHGVGQGELVAESGEIVPRPTAVHGSARLLRQVTDVDGALRLDVDVGLDALDKRHVEVAEVLHLLLRRAAGVALALTMLLAHGPRLALFAHLRLAVQLCECRLLLASQG